MTARRRCQHKKHWRSRTEAKATLEWIHAHPDPTRLYSPTQVIRCRCGQWCLTSKPGKPYNSGKLKARR